MYALQHRLTWSSEAVHLLHLLLCKAHVQQPTIQALLFQGQALMRITPVLRPHRVNDEPEDDLGRLRQHCCMTLHCLNMDCNTGGTLRHFWLT